MRFLDNVLQDFIDRAPAEMEKAKYSAMRERSVGLGVMGFHSFLQSQGVPWESVIAKSWNMRMFRHIREKADDASFVLAYERGSCPDAEEFGFVARFSCKMSLAPTASISIIAGNSSPGIEPIAANVFLQKTLSGSLTVRNRHLKKLLAEKGQDTEEVWSSITLKAGSVQHLDFLTEQEKMVYRTAFELDQRWVIEHAADRTPFICQSQSVNVFLPANVHTCSGAQCGFCHGLPLPPVGNNAAGQPGFMDSGHAVPELRRPQQAGLRSVRGRSSVNGGGEDHPASVLPGVPVEAGGAFGTTSWHVKYGHNPVREDWSFLLPKAEEKAA